MSIIEWAVLGALMFVILLWSARVMKRGLTTLDDDRGQFNARIAAGEKQLEEDRKNISAEEQLYVLGAALEDFLRLEKCPPEATVEKIGHSFEIKTPENTWKIELNMRERLLASTHKVLHGRGQWLLSGPNVSEAHTDLRELMRSLNRHWHGLQPMEPEPDFVARRIAAARRRKA